MAKCLVCLLVLICPLNAAGQNIIRLDDVWTGDKSRKEKKKEKAGGDMGQARFR